MFGNIEQEIHLHSCKGLKGAFEPASPARQIQRLVNLMEVTLMDEGAGKSRSESGKLSHYHNVALFCTVARDGYLNSESKTMQM